MKSFTNSELAAFCGQFAIILRSGISSAEGVSLICEDLPEGDTRILLEDILRDMEAGTPLYEALASSGAFPSYLCNMAKAGELSGRLDDVMDGLAEYYRREDTLSANLRSAVAYPLVMLGLMAAVLIILIIRVLPVFQQVYEQLGADMSGISGALLRFGGQVSAFGIPVVIIFVILLLAAAWFYFSAWGRKKASALFRRLFLSGRFAEKASCSRFAGAMYLSLSSGLEIDQGLEMAEDLADHPVVREKIKKIRELTAEGSGFVDAVSQCQLFPGLYTRMLSLGFKTGCMDHVLKQISEQYDEDLQEQIHTAVSRLEPTLVAILSILVGMILLSVMLPLMGIMSNIG